MPDRDSGSLMLSIGSNGYVSSDDVLYLRKHVFQDGVVSREELAALFALAEKAPQGDREWDDYFAEAASDFFLREEEPHGYLTDTEFAQLEAWICRDDPKTSGLELRLLIALLEKAVAVPAAMTDFAAEQFRRHVRGRKGGARIAKSDVELLRRFLYAGGGAGAVAVTKQEAELLFDLHDLTGGADNDPTWPDLFLKAIASHLMAHIGYRPLPREEALRLHEWVRDQTVDPAGFFHRMFSGGLSAIRDAYGRRPGTRHSAAADDEIADAIAERVTAQEADWLADRIGGNGRLDALEMALLVFMRDLGADLPPKLRALVERAA
jgi:hypothetical protein